MPNSPTFSYKPLWKLLIDRDMTKTQLQELTGLSPATIAKLGRGGNVTTDVLARICNALGCEIEEICTLMRNEAEER
ncbi:helix-turn-helix domain-containing protein [Alloscardovia sp. HMSC034E08]|uniref:helix-turn-helix domain-containing protein n=1 Tax=Alloscardovia sp. HMSC034E08 TaxID=1739413 RepID=UPI0008D17E31|nr:helix-turn-helix transcriptional regulator [Alloscardovia sp. HMSC034E08]OFQ98618.1 transcriptional regulator [Alloscardovia sp. HMSC034E08]